MTFEEDNHAFSLRGKDILEEFDKKIKNNKEQLKKEMAAASSSGSDSG